MGIDNGTKIITTLLPPTDWPIGNVTFSIDVTLLLHKHLVFDDQDKTTINMISSCEKMISNLSRLFDLIEKSKQTKINKIKLFLDGFAPKIKYVEQEKRIKNSRYTINKAETLNYFKNNLTGITSYFNRETDIICDGESEFSMFFNRDKNETNILYSADSDLVAIALNYDSASDSDLVYICRPITDKDTKNLTQFRKDKLIKDYSFSLVLYRPLFDYMNRHVVQLLLLLMGTDFNPTVFSFSMVNAIINEAQESNKYDFLTPVINSEEQLQNIIIKFINLLNNTKNTFTLTRQSSPVIKEFNLSALLYRVFTYYNTGKVKDDVKDLTVYNIDKYLIELSNINLRSKKRKYITIKTNENIHKKKWNWANNSNISVCSVTPKIELNIS